FRSSPHSSWVLLRDRGAGLHQGLGQFHCNIERAQIEPNSALRRNRSRAAAEVTSCGQAAFASMDAELATPFQTRVGCGSICGRNVVFSVPQSGHLQLGGMAANGVPLGMA